MRNLHPELHVDLDVFPGLRTKYCKDRVFVEDDLFAALKQFHGSDLERALDGIMKYFFDDDGCLMWIEGDGLNERVAFGRESAFDSLGSADPYAPLGASEGLTTGQPAVSFKWNVCLGLSHGAELVAAEV